MAGKVAASDKSVDPYLLSAEDVREPPKTLLECLRYVGPGFILSASIVGSGELIATTITGAKAGFVLMWFIIFSCIVKVVVQLEFGKHAICTAEPTMRSLNHLPGPKVSGASWAIWVWLALMLAKLLQVGGIVGGVVLAAQQLLPFLDEPVLRAVSTFAIAASVSLLVFRGSYSLIEKACLVMIASFTLFTLASLISLQSTEMSISSADLLSGIIPNLPENTAILVAAIAAFGITGVGGDEIMAYNYWLIEKGYARYVGPRDDSDAWQRRAQGWIRVMVFDAILSMVAYTAMTVMFYLLGAAILHRQGLVPEGNELINVLSNLYTASLGNWARVVFLFGAVVVLYSTLLAALAAWTRMFSDAFSRLGMYRFEDLKARRFSIGILAWIIPALWAALFLYFEAPAAMVIIGGLATVGILLIVVFAALLFRYQQLDKRLKPNALYDVALWVSSFAIVLVAAYLVYDKVYLGAMKVLSGQ